MYLAIGKINERNMFVYPRSVASRRKLKRLLRYSGCIYEPHNSNITRMIATFQTGSSWLFLNTINSDASQAPHFIYVQWSLTCEYSCLSFAPATHVVAGANDRHFSSDNRRCFLKACTFLEGCHWKKNPDTPNEFLCIFWTNSPLTEMLCECLFLFWFCRWRKGCIKWCKANLHNTSKKALGFVKVKY